MSRHSLPVWYANALRYYVGEAKAYPNVPEDPKAYNTLNVLFFEGTVSERARAAEGKKLNPAFLDGKSDTLSLCADLMMALRYGGIDKEEEETVYRVSRQVDVDQMIQTGKTVSFTSTSKGGFLKAYGDKDGLVLLEIHIAPHAPRADMAELLEHYVKPDEQEVLLPPWLPVAIEKVVLSDAERIIKDRNGDPPVAKYIVRTGDRTECDPRYNKSEIEPKLTGTDAGMRVYEAFMRREMPDDTDVKTYEAWKKTFLAMVVKRMSGENSLREVFEAELEKCWYITKTDSAEDLFAKEEAAAWIRALLGVESGTDFARRIDNTSAERLIHTISTYLLGCHIQSSLLLQFDRLPRIFSKTTPISPFPFFWSLACLCHDLGYSYEDAYKEKDEYEDKWFQMRESDGRKKLLNIEHDFLDLTDAELDAMDFEAGERAWAKESIELVRLYNAYRSSDERELLRGEGTVIVLKNTRTIDHGIAGGLILYDYAMKIANPKPHRESRDPSTAPNSQMIGHFEANSTHSRFTLCCLLIALTVARHNIWTADANSTKPWDMDNVRIYEHFHLDRLILGRGCDKISMEKPVNQLLYMLEYLDTIDPVKTFYTRPLEQKKGEAKMRLAYLLDNITIRCVQDTGNWHHIELSLREPTFSYDLKYNPVEGFLNSVGGIGSWMSVDASIQQYDSGIRIPFPAVYRTGEEQYKVYGITEEEIISLCLYQGSGDTVRPGEFYNLPNAYQSFDLLMMEGLEGERVRIGVEKQRPNGVYIREWLKTLEVFKSVFTAQCKYYQKMTTLPKQLYRSDRKVNTNIMLNHKRTIAYTSTSVADYLPQFSKGKKDPTFLKCSLSQRVPMADYQAMLGRSYAFVDEAEVLLPPFLSLDLDKCRETPKSEYEIAFGDMCFRDVNKTKEELKQKLNSNRGKAAETVDEFRKDPTRAIVAKEDEYREYIAWKTSFQNLVELELSEIWEAYRKKSGSLS